MCVGAPAPSRPADKAYVWDLPVRLFHWLLVACVIAAFVTAKVGGNAMVWHGRLGLAIVGLVVFRIVWGFAGSTYARFARFVRGPRTILAYLRGEWRGQGHNPLGALSVLAMLAALALQGGTGLFANDDIAYQGHLYRLVGADVSERITALHKAGEKLVMLLVLLHLGAIGFYARVKKQNLVRPMLVGWADGKPCESARGGGALAFVAAALIASAAAWAASGAWLPPPPAPAAVETPAW